MRKITLAVGCILLAFNSFAQNKITPEFKTENWDSAVTIAQNEGKAIFIEVTKNNCDDCNYNAERFYKSHEIADLYNSSFVNYKLSPEKSKFAYIVNRYRIKSYPTYLYVAADGTLLHSKTGKSTVDDFLTDARYVQQQQNAGKPIAQWNLEYHGQKLNKEFLYTYLKERTKLGLDNADIIDQYVSVAPLNEVLNRENIGLLLKNRQINAGGSFYNLLLNNLEAVKKSASLRDSEVAIIQASSINYTFTKACNTTNEALLENVIKAKLASLPYSNSVDEQLIAGEFRTKFYYFTRQATSLASTVPAYANSIILHEKNLNEQPVKATTDNKVSSKALFPAPPKKVKMENPTTYSNMLRDAAQYVVEMLSNKSMLNNALIWSTKAIEMSGGFSNYETHAYVLYKLGKRGEAIASMEKAYGKVPQSDNSTRNQMNDKIIKMKRGERIW